MSLDMGAYRATKVSEGFVKAVEGKTWDEVARLYPRLVPFSKEELEDEEVDVKDLKPFLTKVTVQFPKYDYEKCLEDNNLPKNMLLVGVDVKGDYVTYHFLPHDYYENYDFMESVADSEMVLKVSLAKYRHYETEDTYVCFMERVWNYGSDKELQSKLHKAYGRTVTDMGYHRANKEMRKLLVEHEADVLEDEDDVFYWEWY